MKFTHLRGDKFHFEISLAEKDLLVHLLQLYPLVPAGHQQLSQDSQLPRHDENQRLLDESLETQRLENRQLVLALLREPQRFVASATGQQVSFQRGEIEWLLQICNDVRVGCWLALGSPDDPQEFKQRRHKPVAPQAWTMELAAYFELVFLQAVSGDHALGHE